MTTLSLRALWSRRRRLISSFLAVFLGTAFLAGTLVLGDTLRDGIGAFVGHAYSSTDVTVRNATSVSNTPAAPRGPIDASVAAAVARVPGVAVADPVIQGPGQLVKADGSALNAMGPRTAQSWISDPALNPYHVVQGGPPAASGQIVIDRQSARALKVGVGDRVTVLVPEPVRFTVVGVAKFGTEDAYGGGSFVGMTYADAQRYLAPGPRRISSVSVQAARGVSQDQLAARVRGVLPSGVEAITGKELVDESMSSINNSFLAYVRVFLTIFAAVALLVGAFGIHNTFSIVAAQRTRESALLRALGASRGQLVRGMLAEGAVLGVAASLAGALGGLGFAAGLKTLFVSFGLGLDSVGLSINTTPFLVAIPVGIAMTVLASLMPAVRASRVPPVEAMRETSAEPAAMSPVRSTLGSVLMLVGGGLLVWAAFSGVGAVAAVGALTALAAMVVLGPVAVRPAAALLGAVASRTGSGDLAARNIRRSPRRTAGAATALMIGVAVVTLFTVFAASLKQTTADDVGRSFGGDLVVNAGTSFSAGFGPYLDSRVSALPQVEAAAGMGSGPAVVDGRDKTIHAADPAEIARVLRLRLTAGSLSALTPGQIAVSTSTHRAPGSSIAIRFVDGLTQTFTVGAVYHKRDVVGDYLMPRTAWLRHNPKDLDKAIYITLRPGAGRSAAATAIKQVTAPYGAPSVEGRSQYIDSQTSSLNSLLAVVYVMLALAILIALMGIANTLSLAIHERTRELGLLRAVGATRRQTRATVRWESVIIALFGTLGGMALGLVLSWAFVESAADSFAAPASQLLIILVVGALAGVLAAIRPARRAARIPIIQALSTT
jgi:putative ABC transport system permease protein